MEKEKSIISYISSNVFLDCVFVIIICRVRDLLIAINKEINKI